MKQSLLSEVELRLPLIDDGKAIWNLVKETGVLDLNSAYAYLMLCKYFSDTCVVAEEQGRIVGFVSAFRSPKKQDILFVWQVAVAKNQRRKGLGTAMLKNILAREACKGVRFLEITVTASNTVAQKLYRKLANDLQASYEVADCFSVELFPGHSHEAEAMFRIGPI